MRRKLPRRRSGSDDRSRQEAVQTARIWGGLVSLLYLLTGPVRSLLYPIVDCRQAFSKQSMMSESALKMGNITPRVAMFTASGWVPGAAVILQISLPGPGAIGDAIISAFQGFLEALFSLFFEITRVGLVPLLKIVNPATSEPALTAWQSSFEIALSLFPLIIVLGVLNTPLADQQQASLWRQGFRLVTVIFIIAISRPLIGLSVDAINAITIELAPESFTLEFDPGNSEYGIKETFGTLGLLVAYIIAAILMLLAVPLAILGLALRSFLIYVVFIGAPIWAVLWYPDWGMTAHLNEFAAKIGRMGVYTLLAGPVIAIALRTVDIITAGGLVKAGSTGGATQYWTQLVLVLAIPFIILAIVIKSISWAGQPMGLGKAYGMLTTTTLVLAGAAAGALAGSGVGALPGAYAGKAASPGGGEGGGGAGASGSGSGGGGGSEGSAAGAAAAGGTPGGPGDETLDTRMQRRSGEDVKSAGTTGNGSGGVIGERVNAAREAVNKRRPKYQAAQYKQQASWLDEQLDRGEIHLGNADEMGLLEEEPANMNRTATIEDGQISYEAAGGETVEQDLAAQQQALESQANRFEKFSKAGGVVAAGAAKAGRGLSKTGKETVRAGAYGMAQRPAIYAFSRLRSQSGDGTETAQSPGYATSVANEPVEGVTAARFNERASGELPNAAHLLGSGQGLKVERAQDTPDGVKGYQLVDEATGEAVQFRADQSDVHPDAPQRLEEAAAADERIRLRNVRRQQLHSGDDATQWVVPTEETQVEFVQGGESGSTTTGGGQ